MRTRFQICLPILLWISWTDAREQRIPEGSLIGLFLLAGMTSFLPEGLGGGWGIEGMLLAVGLWLNLYPLARKGYLAGGDAKLLSFLVFAGRGPGAARFWLWMGITLAGVCLWRVTYNFVGKISVKRLPLAPWVLTAVLAWMATEP